MPTNSRIPKPVPGGYWRLVCYPLWSESEGEIRGGQSPIIDTPGNETGAQLVFIKQVNMPREERKDSTGANGGNRERLEPSSPFSPFAPVLKPIRSHSRKTDNLRRVANRSQRFNESGERRVYVVESLSFNGSRPRVGPDLTRSKGLATLSFFVA